ncbi:beta-lactamase/transpeptidase-like protein [Hypoxylon cercidicola]|nr:beta-lactamase/transpeptidase-like protein [Hypoxylon cercidicola]
MAPTYNEEIVMELCSMTKLHASVAVLLLVGKGIVTLDEEVSYLIPSFATQKTLAGFADDGTPSASVNSLYRYATSSRTPPVLATPFYTSHWSTEAGTVDELFDLPFLHGPGEGYLCSPAVDPVGQVVRKLTGQSLEKHETIYLGPARGGVPTTFSAEDTSPVAKRPGAPTSATFLKEPLRGQGLCANTPDYVKLTLSLLVNDEEALKEQTASVIYRPPLSPASKRDLLMKTPG